MSKSNSSATTEHISPAGKPTSSFVTEASKSGEYGDNPIKCEHPEIGLTTKAHATEEFASKGSVDFDGTKSVTPAEKPSSTFINTSAVK